MIKTTMDFSTLPAGGRSQHQAQVVNRKVQVHAAESRADERWVSLSTIRVHAVNVYLVTLVDGLGVMADHRITAEPDLNKAKRVANRLVNHLHEPEPEPPEPKPRPKPKLPASKRARPKRTAGGRWTVSVKRDGQTHNGTFDTRKAAESYIATIKNGDN